MNKPESILTDAEMRALICGNPFTLGLSIARLKDFIRQVEKAVVAKLVAEQEPAAWLYEDELPDNYPYAAMFPYSKVDGVRMFPVYAPQPAAPSATDTNDGTKSDDPVGGEYPSNEWVTAFFGSPDDSGFYYFRGDFGNIAHRYKNSAKHLLPQPTDPVVKETLTVPDGWQLVPKEPTKEMVAAFNVVDEKWEDGGACKPLDHYKSMLAAAPTHKEVKE